MPRRGALILALILSCLAQGPFAAARSVPAGIFEKSFFSADTLMSLSGCRGIVEDMWTTCVVDGPTRRHALVYLPSDYYRSGKSYPVVFLIHGAHGNEFSWIVKGNILGCIDSLVTENLAKQAIFVFPNMNQYDDDADQGESRIKPPFTSFFDTDGAVESGFCEEVLALIARKYRIIGDRDHMAIAGLSLGGFQAAYISAARPELFGYIGLFSPFFLSYVTGGKYSWFYNALEEKWETQFAMQPPLYFIAIGRKDFFYEHIWNARMYMSHKGYPFTYYENGGGHNWKNWPIYFCEFYKKLF